MIFAILILLFFAYSIGIFFVDSWIVLAYLAGFQLVLMIMLLVNPLKALRNLVYLFPVVLLTGLFNYFFTDLETAAMVATRLALMCHMTYIFATSISALNFAKGMGIILFNRDAGIVVAVAIAFVPTILREYIQIKQSMNVRGRRRGTFTISMQIFMYRMLYRSANLAQTLDAKAYK